MEVAFSGWLCEQAVEPQSFCPHFGWRENFQNHGFSLRSQPKPDRDDTLWFVSSRGIIMFIPLIIKNSFSLHRGPSKNKSAGCCFDHVSWVISSSRTVLLCIYYLLHTCPMSSNMWSLHAPRCGSPKWKSLVFREFFGKLRVSHGFSQQKARFSHGFSQQKAGFSPWFSPRPTPPSHRLRCLSTYTTELMLSMGLRGTFPAPVKHRKPI